MDRPQSTPATTRPGLAAVLAAQGRQVSWVAAHLEEPVSQSTVSRWVSGERPITPKRVAQLARLLRVPQRCIR